MTQTIGLTEIEVVYHRPAVAGRPVWGGLVPYGQVWRAGANTNTTVRFSTDVSIAGKPLRAGTYGLHAIPTQKDWTLIFSTMSVAWGSYTYDAKEDALRVTVTPRASTTAEERLSYRFDNPTMTSTTLVLAWDKLQVPVAITADTPRLVMANMRRELRGPANFSWEGWNDAAGYWLRNGGNLDEALKLSDRSTSQIPNYANLTTRAAILEKKGQAAAAKEARDRGLAVATEADLNQHGYALVADKKLDEAIAVFRLSAQRFAGSWNAHDSLGEALATKGDKAGAIEAYGRALGLVKDAANKKRIEATLDKLKKS